MHTPPRMNLMSLKEDDKFWPWPGGSVHWSAVLYTEKLWVQSPVGQGSYGRQPTDVSLSHPCFSIFLSHSLFFKKILFIFGERRGKKKKRERNINLWLPLEYPLLGDLTDNPGMHPDWELNQ